MKSILFCVMLLIVIYVQACNRNASQQTDLEKEVKPAFSSYPDSINFKNGFIDNCNKIFNLNSISDGINDSLEIRVWPLQHLSYSTRGFDFKISKDSVYSGWVYHMPKQLKFSGDGKNIDNNGEVTNERITFQSKQLVPVNGWKAFYDSIKSIGIMKLPDQDSIKDHPHTGVLGRTYFMEFATPNSYRRIIYSDYIPDEKHDECFKAIHFIILLQQEFREDFWWPQLMD